MDPDWNREGTPWHFLVWGHNFGIENRAVGEENIAFAFLINVTCSCSLINSP